MVTAIEFDTARHEAAHAVVAHHLGLQVLGIDAGDFPITNVRSSVCDWHKRAIFSCAGPVAEGTPANESDLREALAIDPNDLEVIEPDDLIQALSDWPDVFSDDQRIQYVMLAWCQATDIFTSRWDGWRALTARLVEVKQLDGADVAAILNGTNNRAPSRDTSPIPRWGASVGEEKQT